MTHLWGDGLIFGGSLVKLRVACIYIYIYLGMKFTVSLFYLEILRVVDTFEK